MGDWWDRYDGVRRDWSDLDGPPDPPTTGPDPFAYPLASSLPPADEHADGQTAAHQTGPRNSRPDPGPEPARVVGAEPVVEPPVWEPCDRCGERTYGPNRRDGRLLCGECAALVFQLGDNPPVDDATGLRLLIRSLRNRGRP